jgi:hypothetical protein
MICLHGVSYSCGLYALVRKSQSRNMPRTHQPQENATEHGFTSSYIGNKYPESTRYSLKHRILSYPESIPVACVGSFASHILCSRFLYGENAFIPRVIIVIISTSTCGCFEFARYPLIQFDITMQKNQLNIPLRHMEHGRHAAPTISARRIKT